MKPSEIIKSKYVSDINKVREGMSLYLDSWAFIGAILQYLDEQYEKKCKLCSRDHDPIEHTFVSAHEAETSDKLSEVIGH